MIRLRRAFAQQARWDKFCLKVIYRAKIRTYEEARLLIGAYIQFYNNERIQIKTKLTPLEKRCQFVA